MAEIEPRARIERLLEAAQRLVDPRADAGRKLRQRLGETSGLSPENIELGLTRCLETSASQQDLRALLQGPPLAARAHVLLSSNVFVAPLRAIAVALAAASEVEVRPSRRDPALAEALHALAPELFRLTTELSPRPGDRYFAYGTDGTLLELRRTLPAGVWLHGHGAGFGAVVWDAESARVGDARDIALDTALFDQRGCLSPRVVCSVGSEARARDMALSLSRELAALERELPCGPLAPDQAAAARRERDAAAYAFELLEAGSGWISLAPQFSLPPARRCLHVCWAEDPLPLLAPFSQQLTGVATNAPRHAARLAQAFPGARVVALGEMQRPPLDGPVDRRASRSGELLS